MTTDPTHNTVLQSTQATASAYTSEPWWYDLRGFLILSFAYRSTLWAQIGFFSRNMKARHLEVAIGTATLFSMILAWRNFTGAARVQTVGFDSAAPMLEGARHRVGKRDDLELRLDDVTHLRCASDSFDSANIANALHCFPDVDQALSEVQRVLKPQGTLALNALLVPEGFAVLRWVANRINAWGKSRGILSQVFTEAAVLAAVARAGLTVTHSERRGNTLNVVATK